MKEKINRFYFESRFFRSLRGEKIILPKNRVVSRKVINEEDAFSIFASIESCKFS